MSATTDINMSAVMCKRIPDFEGTWNMLSAVFSCQDILQIGSGGVLIESTMLV